MVLQCPICLALPRAPVVATRCCGQSFCQVCLQGSYNRKRECPLCRKSIRWRDDVVRNRGLEIILSNRNDAGDVVVEVSSDEENEPVVSPAPPAPTSRATSRTKSRKKRDRRARSWTRRKLNWLWNNSWRVRCYLFVFFFLLFMIWLYNYKEAPVVYLHQENFEFED